ncbi:zinc finger protein 728-like [Nylanderia fulva]|uniref:zinc finger protein 728-like n=1 Tax=Nylanderia fulva TaxID=613905 RepID=UPI0010FB5F0D|nr:zinc finger protein 728-like [Nylanderia fulva]
MKPHRPQDYHRRYRGKYTCDACGKEYTWKPSLTRHKREECDYGERNKFSGKQHRGKYICNICGRAYYWKRSLKRHKRAECNREQRFICSFCGRGKKKPQVHQRRKYICDACKKVYTWRCSLRRHIREECGIERQFTCAPCDKRFKHKHHLKEHLCLGRKTWNCVQCGKRYLWHGSLRNHIRLECGKEPTFKCPVCGRKFKHKHRWQSHAKCMHSIKL